MATEQMARLLAMVPYLQTHPGSLVSEVAERFGTTRRQVIADLETVMFCGLPGLFPGDLIDVDIEAATEDGIIYLSNADVLQRPLRFTSEEALSLLLSVEALEEVASGPVAGMLASASEKLAVALGSRPTVSAHDDSPAGTIRKLVTQALVDRHALRLTYDGGDGESEREVEPARIFVRDGASYLHAYCRTRADWRSFHLDRIVSATVLAPLESPREAPPHVQASWHEILPYRAEVTLHLRAEAKWVCEYYAPLVSRQEPDGSVVASFPVLGEGWLTKLLLRLGPDVLSVSPPQLADAARERASLALRHYARNPSSGG